MLVLPVSAYSWHFLFGPSDAVLKARETLVTAAAEEV